MKDQGENSMRRLWKFAAPCRDLLIRSIVLAVFGSALGIVPYIAVSRMVIEICGGNFRMSRMVWMALFALSGYLGQLYLSTLSTIRSHRAAFMVLKNIRVALIEKLSRVPMGFVLDMPSGKFKTLLVDTVERLELPLAHMIPELTANLLIPLLMWIYLFVLDVRLALIAFATFPIGLACYMGMMKDYEKRYARVISAGKNMDAATVEYIGGIEVIKAFNQSSRSYRKYADAVKENQDSKVEWFQETNPYYVAGIAIAPSSLLGVLPIGSYFFRTGSLDAETLISCIILSLGLITPLIQALRYTDSLAMVDATVKAIGELLDAQEMRRPTQEAKPVGNTIEFDRVSFSYGDQKVLQEISFSAVSGGITALVGPSGSGKSTIARLMVSFWEAESGAVKIGGADVRNMPLEQVMKYIAYVSQENYLFHLSIRENIRLGKADSTDEEVEQAAKKASCHDFIQSLPNGYDTMVGDGGSTLSGGERQRIAIARAILKDSPVIILDEATAFTDPENEAVIQRSIGELVAGKTLIVIAHRLSTITTADKIVLVHQGKVEAEGTHSELLKSSPLYRDLWEAHIGFGDRKEGIL